MNLIWVILINVVILPLALILGGTFYSIVEYIRFHVPFTNEMIAEGIIDSKVKKQLLFVELFSLLTVMIILTLFCIVGSYFAGISGYITLGVGLILGLFVFPPSRDRYTRSPYTIGRYVNKHSICMDMEKFNNKFRY